MSKNLPTASASDDNNGDRENVVPISDLTGPALTRAVRQWAKDNGIAVSDRGAVSPDLIMRAALSGATVDTSTLDTSTVYVLTDTGGNAHTVRGPRGKATLDGLAASIGLDAEDVSSVTKNGELYALPRRASAVAVAPWNVTYRDEDGTVQDALYSGGRGRLSVYEVAVSIGVAPDAIVLVQRDGVRYGVEVTHKFSRI